MTSALEQTARAALAEVPNLPRDEDGAVFDNPWEARAFALVVALHQAGHFEWKDWAGALGEEITADKASATETPYYELWLRAAERFVAARGIVAAAELTTAGDSIRAAQAGHDHDHGHDHHHGAGHSHGGGHHAG